MAAGRDGGAGGAVTVERDGGSVVVLRVTGALDLALAPKLRQQVERAVRARPRLLVVDLGELGFLASAGMAELLRAHRGRTGPTQVRIVARGRTVLRPLELTRLVDELRIYPTLDAALEAE
jgi:anti-sigma B factor antagonist